MKIQPSQDESLWGGGKIFKNILFGFFFQKFFWVFFFWKIKKNKEIFFAQEKIQKVRKYGEKTERFSKIWRFCTNPENFEPWIFITFWPLEFHTFWGFHFCCCWKVHLIRPKILGRSAWKSRDPTIGEKLYSDVSKIFKNHFFQSHYIDFFPNWKNSRNILRIFNQSLKEKKLSFRTSEGLKEWNRWFFHIWSIFDFFGRKFFKRKHRENFL